MPLHFKNGASSLNFAHAHLTLFLTKNIPQIAKLVNASYFITCICIYHNLFLVHFLVSTPHYNVYNDNPYSSLSSPQSHYTSCAPNCCTARIESHREIFLIPQAVHRQRDTSLLLIYLHLPLNPYSLVYPFKLLSAQSASPYSLPSKSNHLHIAIPLVDLL